MSQQTILISTLRESIPFRVLSILQSSAPLAQLQPNPIGLNAVCLHGQLCSLLHKFFAETCLYLIGSQIVRSLGLLARNGKSARLQMAFGRSARRVVS